MKKNFTIENFLFEINISENTDPDPNRHYQRELRLVVIKENDWILRMDNCHLKPHRDWPIHIHYKNGHCISFLGSNFNEILSEFSKLIESHLNIPSSKVFEKLKNEIPQEIFIDKDNLSETVKLNEKFYIRLRRAGSSKWEEVL